VTRTVVAVLVVHTDFDAVCPGHSRDVCTLAERAGNRFFHEDGLSRCDSIPDHAVMQKMRHREVDRVDIVSCQQCGVISQSGWNAVFCRKSHGALGVCIAAGGQAYLPHEA